MKKLMPLLVAVAITMLVGCPMDMDMDTDTASEYDPTKDFDTLIAAGNTSPHGIWSNGTTMWVADWYNGKIYAYNMTTKARDSSKDFSTTLSAAGNTSPTGIWSNKTTMWAADYSTRKIYAYNMTTKARDSSKDFNTNTLSAAGNTSPTGIWSNGTTMWVVDYSTRKIYAYNMTTKARDSSKDFNTLSAAGNTSPTGIWSNGTTMWVADVYNGKIYAYNMTTKARDSSKDFNTNTLSAAGNTSPHGIWSNGTTMWVANGYNGKIYAYPNENGGVSPPDDSNPPPPPPPDDSYILYHYNTSTLYPAYINIFMSVETVDGVPVTDLEESDFIIRESGSAVSETESAIRIRKADELPYKLSTVIMLDNSLSIGADLPSVKEAAKVLISESEVSGNSDSTGTAEFAVWTFASSANKIIDFSSSVSELHAAIDSITLGSGSTDLYGAVSTGVSQLGNVFSQNAIRQGGQLVILTDGEDTKGSSTLNAALNTRGNKRVITISVSPSDDHISILKSLGNAGQYAIDSFEELTTAFRSIQDVIEGYANSFYNLSYLTPRAGTYSSEVNISIQGNQNTDSDGVISQQVNVSGLRSPLHGIRLNDSYSLPDGLADNVELNSNKNSEISLNIYYGEFGKKPKEPDIEFTVVPSNAFTIEYTAYSDFPEEDSRKNIPQFGGVVTIGGFSEESITLTIDDSANNLTKTVQIFDFDFTTLSAAGNTSPTGIWSNGTTMWVADDSDYKIYAYNMTTKARDSAKDFTTLIAAGNYNPTGIWSDGTTMWVAKSYYYADKIYAYTMTTKARDSAKDFTTLSAAGNTSPTGIWSDGTTMWVADDSDYKIYAYNMTTKARDSAKDFTTLSAAGNRNPTGIWSNGTTMWVADDSDDEIYAYNMTTKERDSAKDFTTLSAAGNNNPYGIWSNGTTMRVADDSDDKIYAYNMTTKARP